MSVVNGKVGLPITQLVFLNLEISFLLIILFYYLFERIKGIKNGKAKSLLFLWTNRQQQNFNFYDLFLKNLFIFMGSFLSSSSSNMKTPIFLLIKSSFSLNSPFRTHEPVANTPLSIS